MKILGGILVVLGLIAMLYGGVSWTRKDKVLDAGPIEITREKKKHCRSHPLPAA